MVQFPWYFNYQFLADSRMDERLDFVKSRIRSAASIQRVILNRRFWKSDHLPARRPINSQYLHVNRWSCQTHANFITIATHSMRPLFSIRRIANGERKYTAGQRQSMQSYYVQIHERLTTPVARNLHIFLNGHLSVPRNCNKCTMWHRSGRL